MTAEPARRKSYRITGRSLRRGLLFMLPWAAGLVFVEKFLEGAQGRSSSLSRNFRHVWFAVGLSITMKLSLDPTEKPMPKTSEDPLA